MVAEHTGRLRADAEVPADGTVEARLKITVTPVEAGVARTVVVKLEVVTATASRARLIPAPVVCKPEDTESRACQTIICLLRLTAAL